MKQTIAELKKEIELLKEKLSFAEKILDHVPCMIYINEVGRVGEESTFRNIYFNRFTAEHSGISRKQADMLGSEYFRKVMHPDDYEVIDQSIEHLRNFRENKIFGGLYKAKSKDNEYNWVLGRSVVLNKNEEGGQIQVLNAAINLKDELQTKNQILELLKENKRLLNENNILKLSEREREVLKLIAKGESAKTISLKLGISESTVITHRKNMLRKLKMHSSAELVNFAVENGLN